MSASAGDVPAYDLKSARFDRVHMRMRATIGAAGAVPSPLTSQDDQNMSVTHGTAGVYALTFPPAADADAELDVTFVSAAGTIKTAWVTAFSPTAGTASVTFGNGGGTATDPASGDTVTFAFVLNRTKQF